MFHSERERDRQRLYTDSRQRERDMEGLSTLMPDVFMCIYMLVIGEGGERETEREREVYIYKYTHAQREYKQREREKARNKHARPHARTHET